MEHFYTLPHGVQPNTTLSDLLGIEALAIVRDAQYDLLLLIDKLYLGRARIAMARDVSQRFLRNAKKCFLDFE